MNAFIPSRWPYPTHEGRQITSFNNTHFQYTLSVHPTLTLTKISQPPSQNPPSSTQPFLTPLLSPLTSPQRDDGTDSKVAPAVVKLCSDYLKGFIEDHDQNLKYLGLVGLVELMKSHPRR